MRIPISTYRLQFHYGFTFADAKEIISYLANLGISDVYASPIFKARSGSTHGYDVVDATQLNPDVGTMEQFEELTAVLQKYQMGWLQDIVPNHMAYDSDNLYLIDILENGPDAETFDYFDIEWNNSHDSLKGKVLAPLLGSFYGNALENGEIQLNYAETGLSINYYTLKLPVRIESYILFVTHNLGHITKLLGRNHPDFIKLLGVLYLIKSIGETKKRERRDQINFIKGLLWELYTQNPDIQIVFDQNIADFNGKKSDPDSFNLLDRLLSEQFYRLSFWKVGAEEINYRRFFTVNELISVKVEELKVFNTTHTLIERLVQEGKFTGLRVDHIDGLYNPAEYLQRLRGKMGDVYITVEKILELHEELPPDWQIEGTSGYEVLNYINGIFCLPENERSLQTIYAQFTGSTISYEKLIAEKKRLIIETNLAGDLANLAQRLKAISAQTRQGSDFTAYGLKNALTEVLAVFPIYRTYITSDTMSDVDRGYIETAIETATSNQPFLLNELCYIKMLLLREQDALLTAEQQQERSHFIMKFQQLTGPLMAKGVEDTALYIYNRLLALNEVGGNPGEFGISIGDFHRFNQHKCDRWQHSMNTTATHDTKRGEDMRSRLTVLSELPTEWEKMLQTWSELTQVHKTQLNNQPVPDANDEYFLYQTLLGSFPFVDAEFSEFVERVKAYVIKAVREAKVHTAWLHPDEDYENAYLTFIDRILEPTTDNLFLQAFRPFQQQLAEYGICNSLAQVVLRNTTPGVPDLYQGCELWDLSLVDPDNRRPVDYKQRKSILQDLQTKAKIDCLSLLKELWKTRHNGHIKLFLTYQLLQARQHNTAIFQQGNYQPLTTSGRYANHILAFARTVENQSLIVIVPRFLTSIIQPGECPIGDRWQDTQVSLPPNFPTSWMNVITIESMHTGREIAITNALCHFPVALLVSADALNE
jgi:(1->4)-alpha-D-glucan 1-alpha-D-glucosylmutase